MTKAQTTSHHPSSPREDVTDFQRASLPADLEAVGIPAADPMAPIKVDTKPTNVVPIRPDKRQIRRLSELDDEDTGLDDLDV